MLVEQNGDDIPDWISTIGFEKVEGQNVSAQGSSSYITFEVYIKSDVEGNFNIPIAAADTPLCIFGAFAAPLEYFAHGSNSDIIEITSSGELLLEISSLDYESISAATQPLHISVSVVDVGGLTGRQRSLSLLTT